MIDTNLTLFEIMQRFSTEDAAREYLEQQRWPDGPFCPHCGGCEVYRLTPRASSKHPGRKGLLKCKYCRKQFTVTVGTIFEDSHIPLNKWLIAIYLMCSSKKGISAHQIHRMLKLTYKSAWFMCHRIRYAMEQEPFKTQLSGIVEADETYVGGKRRGKRAAKPGRPGIGSHYVPVFACVERGGDVRAFVVESVDRQTLYPLLREHVDPKARIMTDELILYSGLDKHFASHQTVLHKQHQYVKGDVSTNTIEGFFGLLKRGIKGVYHHVSRKHLHRYLAEFTFRYNWRRLTDSTRTDRAIAGFEGKRLKYLGSVGEE